MAEEKGVKKITVGSVFSWIFGILFLLAGVGLLGQGSFVAGIIVILCAAMIIPYFNKLIAQKFHYEISGGIKFVLVIVILITMGIAMANQPATNAQTPGSPSANNPTGDTGTPSQAQGETTYRVGDKVRVGNLQWTITGAERQTVIGDGFITTEANGEFLLLSVEVENVGTSAETFTGDYVKLVDNQGRKFSPDTGAGIYLGKSALVFEQLNPSVVKRGQIVFDIPEGMAIAQVEISSTSLMGSSKKIILNE